MDLVNLLADIDPAALTEMSGAFHERAVGLMISDEPGAQPWGRLYGYLSAEFEVAAYGRQ